MKPIQHKKVRMTKFDNFVADVERNDQNVMDFEDIRFAEIYTDDETPKRKIRKMKKEKDYDRNR